MGWITLILYIGVVLIWAFFAYRVVLAPGQKRRSDRRTLAILTAVIAGLAVLQLMA